MIDDIKPRDRSDLTTIQVPKTLRASIKKGALKEAKFMNIRKLSMVDYLQLLMDRELTS